MAVEAVLTEARAARAPGGQPVLHGRGLAFAKDHDLDAVCDMVEGVRALGLETCVTLGMLTGPQARRLKEAGLDYYNHNLDTSPEYYGAVITTRTYQDRLDTLAHVRDAGIHVCCGGIVGHGGGCRRTGRADRYPGQPAATAGKRADQRPGAGGRHADG